MIELYDLPASPPCRAVKVLARLLEVELNIHAVDLSKLENRTPEFLKMNPFHTVPVINDNGFYLYESHAIMMYLVNKFAPDSELYPKDPRKRALVNQWLSTNNGIIFNAGAAVLHPPLFYGIEATDAEWSMATDSLTVLDGILATRTYAAGPEFTLADIALVTNITIYDMISYDLSGYPNILKYVSHIREKLSPMFAEINDQAVDDFKVVIQQARDRKKNSA